jgi:DNA-binding beta-propeller fold protein YncE
MMKQIENIRQRTVQCLAVVLIALFIVGCASESDPTAGIERHHEEKHEGPEARILVADEAGFVSVIEHGHEGNKVVQTLTLGVDPGDMVATTKNHIFVNVTGSNIVAKLDPVGDQVTWRANVASGLRPVHLYLDPEGTRVWALNDADATTGIDTLTTECKNKSMASVTWIQNHGSGGDPDGGGTPAPSGPIPSKIICVGKGHHKAAFSVPSPQHPNTPRRTFVSNIKDGTVSVIDNEPTSPAYLTLIGTIDLCDGVKQTGGCDTDLTTSNGSAPHGLAFSTGSGMIYNANVGYGTVTVIDAKFAFDPGSTAGNAAAIVATIGVGFSNKIHASPDGRFVVVKGTDTKSDPDHVHGKIAVINVADNSFTQTSLPDLHPDNFEFTPNGKKLYVATATSLGKVTDPNDATKQIENPQHKANLKNDSLLVFDSSALPSLNLVKEIKVGEAHGGHRSLALQEHDGKAERLFVPGGCTEEMEQKGRCKHEEGIVSVVDVHENRVEDTVVVGGELSSIFVFPLEGDSSHH